jgi:hypothetical protein
VPGPLQTVCDGPGPSVPAIVEPWRVFAPRPICTPRPICIWPQSGFCAWLEARGLSCGPGAAEADPDGDGFTNAEEWRFETDPSDAESRPLPPRFLVVERLLIQEFPFRFIGRTKSGDGEITLWMDDRARHKTHVVRKGEMIPGTPYQLVDFELAETKFRDPTLNAYLTMEVSQVTLRRASDGTEISLGFSQTVSESSITALLRDTLDRQVSRVRNEDQIAVRGRAYKIEAITRDGVELRDETGRTFCLPVGAQP